MEKKAHKVFCIGMFRTGTTTMSRCMTLLGYRNKGFLGILDYGAEGAVDKLQDSLPQIIKLAEEHDSFDDAPWLFLYREMDKRFPGSKFILTRRSSSAKLAQSEHNWHSLRGTDAKDILPAEHFVERYEKHNQEVREYFADRPDDFIEICWEEGDNWEKICPFLNEPIPREKNGEPKEIPKANASSPARKWFFMAKNLYRRFFPRKKPLSLN